MTLQELRDDVVRLYGESGPSEAYLRRQERLKEAFRVYGVAIFDLGYGNGDWMAVLDLEDVFVYHRPTSELALGKMKETNVLHAQDIQVSVPDSITV